MNKSLFIDKKGVSEMVSYVLLVVIAIGISVLVYNYLQVLSPKDKPSCPDEVSLSLKSYNCKITQLADGENSVKLDAVLLNKGLHTLDAAYIRIGPEDRKVRELLNGKDIFFGYVSGKTPGLLPGSTVSKSYTLETSKVKSGKNLLEIEPAMGNVNNFALCENAVIVETIECQ